jgi:hypothetical protein
LLGQADDVATPMIRQGYSCPSLEAILRIHAIAADASQVLLLVRRHDRPVVAGTALHLRPAARLTHLLDHHAGDVPGLPMLQHGLAPAARRHATPRHATHRTRHAGCVQREPTIALYRSDAQALDRAFRPG